MLLAKSTQLIFQYMSKKDILDGLPKGWTHTENNGFVHVKEQMVQYE